MRSRSPGPTPFWDRQRHADRRPLLMARGRIKAAIRAHLAAQGFVEVETAALQVSPGNEAHLHAFRTELTGTDLARIPLYLHTSPEFAMKKLLAAGETRIFSFAPVWRNRERGPLHHPEFTMLEWYRAGEPVERLWQDCAEFVDLAALETGRDTLTWRGRTCAIGSAATALMTVAAAFRVEAAIDLRATFTATSTDRAALASEAERIGIRVAADDTWSDIFSRILTERVEPNLGTVRPTILHDYPVHEAALARPAPGDPAIAQRFELYCCGVELANGFAELTDPEEQRRRFESEMAEKQRVYGEAYPIDEDFLAALAHMPEASGCALGFDRLVMLATGAPRIDDVIWTPIAE
ncbi:MAG: EF-P lysine aminoacylase EpmA [Hyphomicrobiaceae bacterium]